MQTVEVFSSKAAKYAKFRWDYSPQAIQAIFDVAGVTNQSYVADIGAGTGILTGHFIGKVKTIFAVEPNPEMRQLAVNAFGNCPSCCILDGRAEAIPLPDQSIDLITVAQAINWFEPQATKDEFLRILKPGGWLAILRNYGTDHEVDDALEKIYPTETDTQSLMKGAGIPRSFYYNGDDYLKRTFAFTAQQTWEEFFGALSTASYAPDEGDFLFASFKVAAKQVFDRFASGGLLESHGVTKLCLGQIAK